MCNREQIDDLKSSQDAESEQAREGCDCNWRELINSYVVLRLLVALPVGGQTATVMLSVLTTAFIKIS